MKVSRIQKGIFLVGVAGALALGCELIVDFDRTKIPVEAADATQNDSAVDATIDTSQPDTSIDAADASDAASDADGSDGSLSDASDDADAADAGD